MNKWEYFFLTINNSEILNPTSNSPLSAIKKLGEEKWELISIVNYPNNTMFAFKRSMDNE